MKHKLYILLLLGAIGLVYISSYAPTALSVIKKMFIFVSPSESDYIELVPSPTKLVIRISEEYYNITNKSCIEVFVNNKPVEFVIADRNTIVVDTNPSYVKNVTLNLCGKNITKAYISIT